QHAYYHCSACGNGFYPRSRLRPGGGLALPGTHTDDRPRSMRISNAVVIHAVVRTGVGVRLVSKSARRMAVAMPMRPERSRVQSAAVLGSAPPTGSGRTKPEKPVGGGQPVYQ